MWPDDAQNTVAANWQIGAVERRIENIVWWTYTFNETPAWNYREVQGSWGYTPSTHYWQRISEQLWCASQDDFDELEKKVHKLIDENMELRQQVSHLQSMVISLDWLVCEFKQVLRFRYVDNDNDR